MSSIPGRSLEDYLEWLLNRDPTPEDMARYEPHRHRLEQWLDNFDEETQSWRDYAGYPPVDLEE